MYADASGGNVNEKANRRTYEIIDKVLIIIELCGLLLQKERDFRNE